jgi:hypothetical protein
METAINDSFFGDFLDSHYDRYAENPKGIILRTLSRDINQTTQTAFDTWGSIDAEGVDIIKSSLRDQIYAEMLIN